MFLELYGLPSARSKRCATLGKQLFIKFYEVPPTKEYPGIDLYQEIKQHETKENVGINIYEISNLRENNEKHKYDLKLRIKSENETNAINLLLYNGHFMYITRIDSELKTKFRCNECGHCFKDKTDLTRYINFCQNFVKEDKFCKLSQIYGPKRNDIVELNDIFETNCDFRFHPIIVYDFEAIVLKRKIQISNKLSMENEQKAISVSLCSNIVRYADEVFIENENTAVLFSDMFKSLDQMAEAGIQQMKEQVQDLYSIIQQLTNEKEKGKYLKILDDYCTFIPVIGFNSGSYDINLNAENFI